jgi:hypothetical protein
MLLHVLLRVMVIRLLLLLLVVLLHLLMSTCIPHTKPWDAPTACHFTLIRIAQLTKPSSKL